MTTTIHERPFITGELQQLPGSRCVWRTPDTSHPDPDVPDVWEVWGTYSPEHARVCLAALLETALSPSVAVAVDAGRLDKLAHAVATSPLRDDVRRLALLLHHEQSPPGRVRARLVPLAKLPRCGPDGFGDAVAALWGDEAAGSEAFDLVPSPGWDGPEDTERAGESA